MIPRTVKFYGVDCSAVGLALDRMGQPVQVEVGEYTVASVQVTFISGTRATWTGNVRKLNAPVGVAVDFSAAMGGPVQFTAAGVTDPIEVAHAGWLSFWHTAVDAGLRADITINLSRDCN